MKNYKIIRSFSVPLQLLMDLEKVCKIKEISINKASEIALKLWVDNEEKLYHISNGDI